MNDNAACCGAVLTLTLVIVLSVSIMLGALLHMSSGVPRIAVRDAYFVANSYLAESAVIAHLAMFPQGYFEDLPAVHVRECGPWGVVETLSMCENFRRDDFVCDGARAQTLVGREKSGNTWNRYADWADGAESYRRTFFSRVNSNVVRLSGNRRFFKLQPQMSYAIENGDLTLDASGHVRKASFYAQGSAMLKGTFVADTLLLYAEGPVSVRGNVQAKWLEIYSREEVRLEDGFAFAGHVWGRGGVEISGRVQALFPSVVLAMGSSLSNVNVRGRALVQGVVLAPNGLVEIDPSVSWDSTDAVLPYYVDGSLIAFSEVLEREERMR